MASDENDAYQSLDEQSYIPSLDFDISDRNI